MYRKQSRLSIAVLSCLFWPSSVVPTWGFQETTEPITSPRYQKYLEDLMKDVDRNGDREIDSQEARESFRPVLQNADINQDGVITGREILQTISSTQAKDRQEPKSIVETSNVMNRWNSRLTVTILKLPESFARSQTISIDDILKKLTVDSNEDTVDIKTAIPLLDQIELELVDGRAASLTLGGSRQLQTGAKFHNGTTSKSYEAVDYGTSLSVKPEFDDDQVQIAIVFNGAYIVKKSSSVLQAEDGNLGQATPIQVRIDTKVVLDQKKNVSAINMLVSGHHILALFKMDAF